MCIYFDMFEDQTEIFCNPHCNSTALIFFDCGIMQRFDFSDEVSGWASVFLRKHAVRLKLSYSFFENLRIRPNGYHYTLFTFILCSQSRSVSQCPSVSVSMAGKLRCRSLVFIYFIGGSSSYSFSSFSCWLSTLTIPSKSSLESCCPWVSSSCVMSLALTLFKLACCAGLLMSSPLAQILWSHA